MNRKARIAAVFDVDGTLIVGNSLERTFINFLVRHGELRASELVRFLGGAFDGIPLPANKAYLRGKDYYRLSALARICFTREIEPRLLPAALARIRWHQASGHEVALLSGTLDLLLAPLAERLGIGAASGTHLEMRGQQLSGRITGGHPFGEGKVERLRELARRFEFDPRKSFAYADHFADRHLLERVGYPVAVNPDRELRRVAETRGWMIEDFTIDTGRLADHGVSAPITEGARA